MKKFQFISALVMVVLALCSCTNTDYQNVIPANASLVVKVDMKSIAEKSDFKNSKWMKELDGSLGAVVSGKDMKSVKEYVADPMKIGIDFSMPLYFFMMADETMGMTMKVSDEDHVKDFLLLLNKQGLASKPQEKDHWMCGTLIDDIYYSYDGTTFLMLASMKGKNTTISRMARELTALKESDSFVSTEAFGRLNEEEKDVVMYVMSAQMIESLKMAGGVLPSSVYKDVEALASLDFAQGEARIMGKLFAKTKDAQHLIDEANANLKKMNGRYLDKVSDDAAIWIGAGVKGEWLLEKIKENKELKTMLFATERAVDVEQMLKAMDGDVSLELPLLDTEKVDYVLQAELNNTDFLADVNDWKLSQKDYGIEMKELEPQQYQLMLDGQTYRWGVRDKDLYWATPRAVEHAENSADAKLKAYREQIEDSRLFLFVDWAKLAKGLSQSSNVALVMQMWNFFFKIDALYWKLSSVEEGVVVIESKNKNENFLKQILQ
ncbi:MAG: DUF4836 family protein [Bacteroidaceae bacterium]|nr:DUF4836 family protein [Bacteroidaceae bacterium]